MLLVGFFKVKLLAKELKAISDFNFFFVMLLYNYRPKRGNVIDVAGITSMTKVK